MATMTVSPRALPPKDCRGGSTREATLGSIRRWILIYANITQTTHDLGASYHTRNRHMGS